jgi:putative FmdB family regulatory protein
VAVALDGVGEPLDVVGVADASLALSDWECQPGGAVPTYEYACTECGHEFEAVQSFSDAALTVCPECGGRLRKVFSAVGVVFKGSGFYRTDSRGSETGTKKADTKPGDAKPAGKSESTSSTGGSDGGSTTTGGSTPSTSSSSSSTAGTAA